MSAKKQICIVGSGNWGSVIAKIIGNNIKNDDSYADQVNMYVYEEIINGEKLSEIINTRHENVKYLPGVTLPTNVVAVTDIVESAKDADVLVWVLPHQFVRRLCGQLKGKIKSSATAISLIKGLDINEKGLDLISNVIRTELSIPCSVLMGANVANDVAKETFCEATIGCRDKTTGAMLKSIMQTSYFRITVVPDEVTVELCGALKNIVANGAGFCDGLGYGDNTKAAIIRLGLMEMFAFVREFFNKDADMSIFLESCGVADLVTTCYSGRNRRVAEAFVKTGKSIVELETEMLNGQSLQGPPTAHEVNLMLKQKNLEQKYPLFTAIHKICTNELPAEQLIDCLRQHPAHM